MTPDADPTVRYEFAVLEWLSDEPVLRAAVWLTIAALAAMAVCWYWRERRAVRRGAAWWMLGLRLVALAAVAAMALGPQRRTAEVVKRPSRVAVLVDNSLSMSLANENRPGEGGPAARSEAVRRALAESPLLEQLAADHALEVIATDGVARAPFPATADEAAGGLAATLDRDRPPAPRIDPQALDTITAPATTDTRLGDAIDRTLDDYSGRPLAGIVLLSDGLSNAGRDALAAAARAAERGAPLHTLGFGPSEPGVNLAVRDLTAPARAFVTDELQVTAVVEFTGAARQATASLFRRPAEQTGADAAAEQLLASQSVAPPDSSKPRDVRQADVTFTTPPPEVGRYVYSVRLAEAPDETNRADNARDAEVEVVDRVLRVLLLAGGPARDYRFLRDQVRRDAAFEVDVLLQSAESGVAQDADRVLDAFPTETDALARYDVIAAFDPDWGAFGGDAPARLEEAVSDHGVGLLYVPGPVHAPRWLGSRDPSRIKALLPAKMPDRWLALSTSAESSRVRSPLRLTAAGAEAEFLWIAGDRERSLEAWREFPGFYRCFPVQAVKPGATVYAWSDPATGGDAALGGSKGVLLAEQFFGAGRVMLLTSGELWRLRKRDPAYFTTLTTKLLQHLSQGRLLANAPGGSLLFERARYRVGETVTLRASRAPADPESPLPLRVVSPGGVITQREMAPSPSRPGVWVAQWTASEAGGLRALVSLPGGGRLSARVEISVPAQERNGLVRDAELLAQLAAAGNGNYYPTAASAVSGAAGLPRLAVATPSQAETTLAFGQPDPDFSRRVSAWALGLVGGCLILEWCLRRLNRLA